MKALFIGGTGVISTAVGALALARGWELTLLNRGTNTARAPRGARVLTADIHDEAAVKAALGDERFDVAVDFIAFTEEDVQRDVRLFAGRGRFRRKLSKNRKAQRKMPCNHNGKPVPAPLY